MSMPCWLADLMMRGSSNSNIAAMATHRDPLAQFLPILFLLLVAPFNEYMAYQEGG